MIQSILSNFPKKREELPEAYKKIYDLHYQRNRQGETKATSLSMKMEQWLHKMVAKDVRNSNKKTLEIGAGTLNQLEYEPLIEHYDVIEPFKKLYENSPQLNRIKKIYTDIFDISPENKYERITSVATFEHILNLPAVVAKAALLLEDNGSLRVSIPNEGTILWKLGTMITGAEFKRMYGLNYKLLLNYEHVNTAKEIETILKYFFAKTKIKIYGINKKFAFYMFISCKNPNIERAKKYLQANQ